MKKIEKSVNQLLEKLEAGNVDSIFCIKCGGDVYVFGTGGQEKIATLTHELNKGVKDLVSSKGVLH